MPNHLRIEKADGDLYYYVYEVVGMWVGGVNFYSGSLSFSTGVDEGWWFCSVDGSIRWNLGPRLKDAMKELRRRYLGHQKKSDRSRSRKRGRRTNGDRSRVRKG